MKNFTDKKNGGKSIALVLAKAYRDELLENNPPISRKEFSCAIRKNNRTGISGVYKYAKPYTLRDGTLKETWYWEANWPTEIGESGHQCFSITRYGEEVARQMAIRARERGLRKLSGVFWASERGTLSSLEEINSGVLGALSDSECQQTLDVA
ncbi:MAG: AP2 domain-containing protein [Pseudomonadales bacterium]